MNSDFKNLLQIFAEEEVEYLIVGGYAVIFHAQPRYTKDLALWLNPTCENAKRVARAFQKFGVPMVEITEQDLAAPGLQYVIGLPPCQIDFLTTLPGVKDFQSAWNARSTTSDEGFPTYFLAKSDLITAKKTAARPQDLADIDELSRDI